MKQERAHHHNPTAVGEALHLSVLLAQGFCLVRRQTPMPVRPRYNPEWTALRAGVVEVQAHSDQGFQHRYRRLDIQNAFLLRPPRALRMRDTLLDRNGDVLV
jgi:hypothetical protein